MGECFKAVFKDSSKIAFIPIHVCHVYVFVHKIIIYIYIFQNI